MLKALGGLLLCGLLPYAPGAGAALPSPAALPSAAQASAAGSAAAIPSSAEARTIGYFEKSIVATDVFKVDNYIGVVFLKQVGQTLVDTDRFGALAPAIAESWSIGLDRRTYVFKLRAGLRFHDGRALEPEDVIATYKGIARSAINPLAGVFADIAAMKKTEPRSLSITLKKPLNGFMKAIASGLATIVPRRCEGCATAFVGSGPYKIEKREGSFFLVPNTSYLGPYPPSSVSYRLLFLEEIGKGAPADIVLDGIHYSELSEKVYDMARAPEGSAFHFLINPTKERWRDPRKREALLRALLPSKKILESRRRENLGDLFARGMEASLDPNPAYERLLARLEKAPAEKLGRVTIASLEGLPHFPEIVAAAKDRGADLAAVDVRSPGFLRKMKKSGADVFAVGWTSPYAHPESSVFPFFELGFAEVPGMKTLADRFRVGAVTEVDYYREMAKLSMDASMILPHSQGVAILALRRGFSVPKSYYRYGFRLSEVEKSEASHGPR